MDENTKTFAFMGGAVLMALVAWIAYPRLPEPKAEDMRGKELFAEFTDPLKATSLEIVRWDESTGKVEPFQVAQINDRWCIPSHHNYPADAKDHLAEAATSVIGLKVLDVVSQSPGDHELYGVVDPDPKTLKPGQTGVGMRVTMRDKDNNVLLSLIVGKEVEGKDGLRYVRCAGQDPVYVVALSTDKLTTRFEDWIEEDLLKLNTWDVKQVEIYDYSFDAVLGQLAPRNRIVLDYDDKDAKWSLARCDIFAEKGWQPEPLKEDEELNTTKLNDMKWALDDLKIVDVVPKPKGLSKALKGEGQLDEQALASLEKHGFHVRRGALYSSQGEITVLMKDGVQYVLRFGNVATESKASTQDEKSGEDKEGESTSSGVNRYVFVMAEFNPDAIPKPELEPLPELPEEAGKSADQTADEQAEPAPKQVPDGDGESQSQPAESAGKQPAAEPAPSGETSQKGDSASESSEAAKKTAGSQPAEAAPAGEQSTGETEAKPAKTLEEIKKERERIEKENQRKKDKYEKKLEEGRKRVKELNERFADWYYIISDEVYRKIHLGRSDVVQKKEAEEGEQQSDAEESSADKAEEPQPEMAPTDTPEQPAPAEAPEGSDSSKPAAEPEQQTPATQQEKPPAQPGDAKSAEKAPPAKAPAKPEPQPQKAP